MMLAGPHLRTVPLTVHLALAEVPSRLSVDLICHKPRIVDAALRHDFGLAQPRLAVAALNPHPREGGAFGDEAARIITPAIAEMGRAHVWTPVPTAHLVCRFLLKKQ